jgi:hypothetical protein
MVALRTYIVESMVARPSLLRNSGALTEPKNELVCTLYVISISKKLPLRDSCDFLADTQP